MMLTTRLFLLVVASSDCTLQKPLWIEVTKTFENTLLRTLAAQEEERGSIPAHFTAYARVFAKHYRLPIIVVPTLLKLFPQSSYVFCLEIEKLFISRFSTSKQYALVQNLASASRAFLAWLIFHQKVVLFKKVLRVFF